MTKLSDKLANLGQTEPGRLGFGPRQARQKTPSILIAGVTKDGSEEAAKSADVLILSSGTSGKPATKAPESEATWGASLSTATAESLDALKEAGAGFVLIESLKAPSLALRDDEMDRGLVLSGEATDRQADALNDSKFEFFVYDGTKQSWPLTVGGVMELQEQVSLYSKHIFLKVESLPTADDLEPLRDMPVSAIVVDLAKVDAGGLKELRERIASLEPRKNRDGSVALVPNSRSNGSPDSGGDDDDDWDDDDY